MKKDLYVFRHGGTDFNRDGKAQGQSCDISLNETGIRQANEMADNLKGVNIEVIYSSPLLRAYQTALCVAKDKRIEV